MFILVDGTSTELAQQSLCRRQTRVYDDSGHDQQSKRILVFLASLSQCDCWTFFGTLLGMLGLYFVMILLRSDFGLDNVCPVAALGAVLGLIFGLFRPRRWSLLDFVQ